MPRYHTPNPFAHPAATVVELAPAPRVSQPPPQLTTAAQLPPADEQWRFEQQATHAFPDLNLTVGIFNKRNGLGWVGRTYVLRTSGQALGVQELEVKAASIEEAIAAMIRQVGPVRRQVRQAREQAHRSRAAA